MYVADHLSRASLANNKEMTDSFQVFALEVETVTPFDSIKVAPERLSQLQKCTAQDLILETLKTTVLKGWPKKEMSVQCKSVTTGIIEKRFHCTMVVYLRVRE